MNSIWHEWVFVDSCCGNGWKLVINNVSGLGFKKKIVQFDFWYVNVIVVTLIFITFVEKKQSPWTANLHTDNYTKKWDALFE